MFTFSWLCFYFSIWRLPWPRGSIAASRLLLVAFFCMATAMAERQRRGIEALACCFFLYADCHGREAASRHRGSCLLLFSVWRLPWPRGSVAASRLLLVAFFYMATAMAERQRSGTLALACCFFCMATAMAKMQRSGILALMPLSAAPHQSVQTSTHRLLPFLLFH